jgi:hypothetical protein
VIDLGRRGVGRRRRLAAYLDLLAELDLRQCPLSERNRETRNANPPSRLYYGREREALRVSDHQPLSGTWDCLACFDEWPCQTRRRQLLAWYEGAPDQLAAYLASSYARARSDLRHVPVVVLHRRFVGWVDEQLVPQPASRGDLL